ncbi:MAG: glycosyltransferase family 2 protein [Pseudomonadota bacterium]
MPHQPSISVIMAAHNAGRYVGEAMATVLAQTHGDLELIIADDGSTDETADIACALARREDRVRVLRSDMATGPAAARNRALAAAQGAWLAIVDADDLIHPRRLAELLRAAENSGADVIADDLIRFGAENGQTLLKDLHLGAPWTPDATGLLAAELGDPAVPVGYLKPLIRRSALGDLRYREEMSVGEDLDLLLRLTLAGARVQVLPQAYYLYRRHTASISHRLSPGDIDGMRQAAADLAARRDLPPDFAPFLAQWQARLDRQHAFATLVADLKARRTASALGALLRKPRLLGPLLQATGETLARRLPVQSDGPTSPRLTLPGDVALDAPGGPARLVARTGQGTARLRIVGAAGLDALGFVPGWTQAELVPPAGGWTPAQRAQIAALSWPVTIPAETITPELVHIRTPTYQRPETLHRALASLRAQTHEHWICDVYDDDPKGSALAVVTALGDPRIRYHNGPRRHFAAGNIDRCFSRSNPHGAAYFCTLEDDNYFLPGFLAENIRALADIDVEIVFRNQRVEFNAETAAARVSDGGLLDRRLTERVYEAQHFRLALLADIGISNGGLFWSHRAVSDLQVHVTCSAVLQEYYRTFAIEEPIFVAMEPLAVWAENGAGTGRHAGNDSTWLKRELTLKASIAQLQRKAWQQATPEMRAAFLDDRAFSYPRDQRARGLVKSLMRLNVRRALPSSEVARLALRGLAIRLLGRPEPSVGEFLELQGRR